MSMKKIIHDSIDENMADVAIKLALAAIPAVLKGVAMLVKFFKSRPKKEIPISKQLPGEPAQLREQAKQQLGIDSINNFNFCFAGFSGVGKSTLINTLRNVKINEPNAAPSGPRQVTLEVKAYQVPGNKHIVFWDIPGAATDEVKAKDYFDVHKLYAFDVVVLLTADRFRDCDHEIAKAAMYYDIPVVLVRTKSDIELQNLWERLKAQGKQENFEEEKFKYRDAVREDFKKHLPKEVEKGKLPMYVISSRVLQGIPRCMNYELDEQEFATHLFETAAERRGLVEHLS